MPAQARGDRRRVGRKAMGWTVAGAIITTEPVPTSDVRTPSGIVTLTVWRGKPVMR